MMNVTKVLKLSALSLLVAASVNNYAYNLNNDTVTPSKPETAIPTPAEDAIITKSVSNLLKKYKTTSNEDINVTTKEGVVYLKGVVNSNSEASNAVEHAQSVIGVQDVDASDLTVKDSTQPLTDTWITAKIKGLFLREKIFGGKDIAAVNVSVETNNGVVYLIGHIDNKQQLKNAIDLIKKIKGVTKVEYNVKKLPATNDTNKASQN